MRRRPRIATAVILLTLAPGSLGTGAPAPRAASPERQLERRFATTVRPFVESYCVTCHEGEEAPAQFDLSVYEKVADVLRDHPRWALVQEKLGALEMPPEQARIDGLPLPTLAERQAVIDWIDALRRNEARKNAGDPGLVLARRLSNAEYNYTIRDLTGVDLRPTREFPVDPANPAGFDNSGESLSMSPALTAKYLQAAREVANHLVFKPDGLAFAPHPMLVETDRDKYCVQQILDFYARQPTDYAAYFEAAWTFKHRAALGRPTVTLAQVAARRKVSPRYLATIWKALEETPEEVGPLARLQAQWRELPGPAGTQASDVNAGASRMREFVVALRRKIERRHPELEVKDIRRTAQPFLMWRNHLYATHRLSFDPAALQVEGETPPAPEALVAAKEAANDAADEAAAGAPKRAARAPDPDLQVPAGERARYEAAFARFAAVFPDAFYVSERGRYFPDNTRDKGRHLSAGFHNLMGYFRDDRPLYDLVLDAKGQKELDALWHELDFVAAATARTYVQFYLNETGVQGGRGAGAVSGPAVPTAHPATAQRAADASQEAGEAGGAGGQLDITSEPSIQRVAETYLAKARASGNALAEKVVDEHFRATNAAIRQVEKARVEAEPRHLEALQQLAARAYRRPLSAQERDDLAAYYRALREASGLDHEEAVRDVLVSVLMSPDFCYRVDLVGESASILPLSDHALASRLSYFLWASLPDAELLRHAAAGDLRRPDVLTRQVRRMLKDERVRGLATEFGGNWLNFRRFEEHNAVDRERFPMFDHDLRQAMFEEPVRFLLDVFREDRSVLDFLYAKHTFVNPVLARHYGIEVGDLAPSEWRRVDEVSAHGRGGLLPMSVFLTKNAPGLRTSPVKRGYWVVKDVLGERIPPPPPVVPELPRDEAKLDLPVRDALVRHRQDPACASCHARFDSYGLVFEGYGPVGERRDKDLAGRPVDASAKFAGGKPASGLPGLREHIRATRQDDFVRNLSRKLLAYALGRSLTLSDDPTLETMQRKLAADGYRFSSLVESIVKSRQFQNKRGRAPQTASR